VEKYDKKAAELLERSYQTPEIVNQRLRTLAVLGLQQGESVLDAGCGTGLLIEQEAKAVGAAGRAEGMDYSDDMLEHALRRCADMKQVGLQQGTIEKLPFEDASFDALSCTQTLLYVADLEAALAEFQRVLKPRGRIAIVETDWSGAIINSEHPVMTRRILDNWGSTVSNGNLPRRLRPMLGRFGFSAIRAEAIPLLNASYCENSFSANMLQNFATSARRHKVIDAAEAESWLQGIDNLIKEDAYFFCVNRFLFSAVK